MFQVNAVDKDGIPRVWGRDTTPKKAETQARWELMDVATDQSYDEICTLIREAM